MLVFNKKQIVYFFNSFHNMYHISSYKICDHVIVMSVIIEDKIMYYL